ncbi:hypothetical protein J4219_03450 [Candidatus Woesearchaeota archaeon]|nr:hypothetical protein [Candidatus Woesearchaeota archaeon]
MHISYAVYLLLPIAAIITGVIAIKSKQTLGYVGPALGIISIALSIGPVIFLMAAGGR